MFVASSATQSVRVPRRPRLDAVLALRYRHDAGGVRVHCDYPFAVSGGRLDIPLDVWRSWRRLRLHIVPTGDVPPTVLLLADSQGNPLFGAGGGPIHALDRLDADLFPTPMGAAFSLVVAGPAHIATVSVSLHRSAEADTRSGLSDDVSLPIPRVREVVPATPMRRVFSDSAAVQAVSA